MSAQRTKWRMNIVYQRDAERVTHQKYHSTEWLRTRLTVILERPGCTCRDDKYWFERWLGQKCNPQTDHLMVGDGGQLHTCYRASGWKWVRLAGRTSLTSAPLSSDMQADSNINVSTADRFYSLVRDLKQLRGQQDTVVDDLVPRVPEVYKAANTKDILNCLKKDV